MVFCRMKKNDLWAVNFFSAVTMELLNNFDAVRTLINIYMLKKLKRIGKPVCQEKFVEDVRIEFKEKHFNYSTKSILCTWKSLLDTYQFYKKNFSDEDAKKEWKYFDLMDNCFDDTKQTCEKFKEPQWIFCLLNSLGKHRRIVLKQGLTMPILHAVEKDFQKLGYSDISLKDIYNQWNCLKKFYRQSQQLNYHDIHQEYVYYNALKNFFDSDVSTEYSIAPSVIERDIYQTELDSAVETILPTNENSGTKRIILNESGKEPVKFPCKKIKVASDNKFSIVYAPFTIVMHDILLQFFKKHNSKIRTLNGEVDEETLVQALEEFQKLGYSVSKESVRNEWNDLTYRYELIKNTEHPQKWPYFNDMNCIYSSEDVNNIEDATEENKNQVITENLVLEHVTETQDIVNYNAVVVDNSVDDGIEDNVDDVHIDNLITENVIKTQRIANKDAEVTGRLLNVYENNTKEFVEIKDILVERNLLKEETNYLLNIFVDKFNNRKCKLNSLS